MSALVTAAENPSRSTASAPPAGTWLASAARMISEPKPAHFGMQQPDRVVGGVVGAERIGADQFGEAVGAVRLGHPMRAHLVQHHADAGIGDLPGGFRAGEAGADDVNGFGGEEVPVMAQG